MINFDSLTLKALLKEIEPILTAGRIQKVQQLSKSELVLGIRSQGENYKLYGCVNPKYPHICFLTEKSKEYRDIQIPKKPPMFCMLLRKHIEGSKIQIVKQPSYERILEIYFDGYNELGIKTSLVLAFELMGKHSNIMLYNYDTNVILGCAHNVGPEKSKEREIAGGLPYIYPPKSKKIDLLQISEQDFAGLAKVISEPINIWLNKNFDYISLALATELCNITENKINDLYQLTVKTLRLENLNTCISADKKLFSLIGQDNQITWEKIDSVNSMTDLYFGYQVYFNKLVRLKANLSVIIEKELKKLKNKYIQYKKAFESGTKAEKYRQYADILMANLHKIEPEAKYISLENFFENNQDILIELDPSLSGSMNAQKYYKLYNKAKNAAKISKDLILQTQNQINYLESTKKSIDQAKFLDDLNQIQDELISQDFIKPKYFKSQEKSKKERINLTQYISSDGYKIYLGKNDKQNDYLVSKIASSEDIWLHVQNMPGAHVLIKAHSAKENIPETTLYEAANLAAYFSQGKNSLNVPVIYTKRKFLKKPSSSKPGYVTYSNEKTLFVNPAKPSFNASTVIF
ncbi:MAG: NFACT family protein [bacterium]